MPNSFWALPEESANDGITLTTMQIKPEAETPGLIILSIYPYYCVIVQKFHWQATIVRLGQAIVRRSII